MTRFYTTAMCPARRVTERRFRSIRSAGRICLARRLTGLVTALTLISGGLFAAGALSAAGENPWVRVLADGKPVALQNAPFWQDEELYLPLREVLTACGIAEEGITYENGRVTLALPSAPTGRTVTATVEIGAHGIVFDTDANNYKTIGYYGGKRTTTHPVLLSDGVTYAPLGVFIRIADYSLDERTEKYTPPEDSSFYTRATRFHLLDNLEIRQFRSDGTFDVLLSPPLDTTGENRLDPAAYYTPGEAVIIETADQLNARYYPYREINGYYFPTEATKVICVDDAGRVRGIALVQNQRHEAVNRCDMDTFSGGFSWPKPGQTSGIGVVSVTREEDGSPAEETQTRVYTSASIIYISPDQATGKHGAAFYIPTHLMVQGM